MKRRLDVSEMLVLGLVFTAKAPKQGKSRSWMERRDTPRHWLWHVQNHALSRRSVQANAARRASVAALLRQFVVEGWETI